MAFIKVFISCFVAFLFVFNVFSFVGQADIPSFIQSSPVSDRDQIKNNLTTEIRGGIDAVTLRSLDHQVSSEVPIFTDSKVGAKRVAIIGAGPSGLAQLRAFQSASQKGADIPEVVCFEKQEDWGGHWHYLLKMGLDEYGEFINSSINRYLWSGGSAEGYEFADYSFDEHFGKAPPIQPSKDLLWDYFVGRIEKAGVRGQVRFRTPVRRVEFNEISKKFRVVAHDLNADKEYEELFDYVIVASGRFSEVNMPYFKGFEKFKGRILHSHYFKEASEFKGKDVLVIGSGYSVEEVGVQCWQSGSRSVIASHRKTHKTFEWSENWEDTPQLSYVDQHTAYFSDGLSAKIDAIILCTGYLHHFPFLEEKLKLRTTNRLAANNLFKGVVWVDNPQLFFVGMQDKWFTFNMLDAQTWYVRDIILEKTRLPSQVAMIQDVDDRLLREEALRSLYDAIKYQAEYVKELLQATDCPDLNVDVVRKSFYQWKKNMKKDTLPSYSDNIYLPSVKKFKEKVSDDNEREVFKYHAEKSPVDSPKQKSYYFMGH